MRLRSLSLRNYRRFKDAFLEFPDGVTAIVGPNGAGKSTLIEALAWCLYGHEAARTGKELLKRARAAPGEDVFVRLEFELDDQSYCVTRRLRGKSQQTEAQLDVNGTAVVAPGANSSEATTQQVSRLLGMDRRGFLASVVAKQGELSALSDAQPGDRKRLLLGLLGIEAIDAAIQRCRTEKRESLVRLVEARKRLERQPQVRARLDSARRELAEARTGEVALATEVNQSRERLSQFTMDVERLAELREHHRDLRTRLEGYRRSLQTTEEHRLRLGSELQLLDEKFGELERTRLDGARFTGLDERWTALEEHRRSSAVRDRLAAERSGLEGELERWEKALGSNGHRPEEVQQVADQVARLRENLEEYGAEAAKAETRAAHLESERERLQRESMDDSTQWRDLRDLGPEAPCPLCGQALGRAIQNLVDAAAQRQATTRQRVLLLTKEIETERFRVDRLLRDRSQCEAGFVERETHLQRLRQHIEAARAAAAERERLAARIKEIDGTLAETTATPEPPADAAVLDRLRSERERWSKTVARLEAETSRIPRLRSELDALAPQADEARGHIEAATRELGRIGYMDGSWERAQRSENEERLRLHERERRIDVLKERIRGLDVHTEQLVTELRTLEADEKSIQDLEEHVKLNELLAADRGDVGLLPEFRAHLIARTRPALAKAASDIVAQMTQGRYTELTLDEDYAVRLYDGGESWPIERYSGGEADVVHLAVRLAVSELLAHVRRASRLRFVALDEVLASQDDDRRKSVLGSLRALAHHFRQVLVVTHLDEVRERVDHVIRVTPLPDGSSVATAGADRPV